MGNSASKPTESVADGLQRPVPGPYAGLGSEACIALMIQMTREAWGIAPDDEFPRMRRDIVRFGRRGTPGNEFDTW